MMINGIQFQKGLSLPVFMQQYGTETQCEEHLIRARWPHGFHCPRCGHDAATQFMRTGTRYWQCKACQRQTSLRAGTLMEHSHLPLTTWFLAIYLVTQSKTNIAALALMRELGNTWHAAWLLKHKLMEAMRQSEATKSLQGDIRIDDAYLGGEKTGGKAGRGSENKVAFAAAMEMRNGRPQRVRFDAVAGFTFAALKSWALEALAPGCCVTSDGLLGFEVLRQLGYHHEVRIAPRGKAGTEIEPFSWLNILLGNLKTTLSGTYHAFKFAKYAQRYLSDVQYRFNRRFDLAAMIPCLARDIMRVKPCTRSCITKPN
ncbi:IS1595 family transposase [Enterobacter sp. BIDMC 29]|uniref:IS1595 family transposase n=1 Tax=Enterobacter sp. BIDMC 29 TaxID=1329841 RepID=UPI0012DBE9FA|nr:IS1595 family transposase [Enterobacter sp. BIDMC 29]